ncbi:hypothetical protein KY289_001094 [Solanum tuberosum]|nr:hypothetical protein KY289_001094 [Solanum tuberosum]
MKKHDKPLWLNEEFFIRLPFKRNENINPTRASHSGMNLEHLQLAKKEFFYFNKQAEQARGFWQLGIHPKDKSKTGFYIPDHHYQWKVMPFGLKPAPSLFQKDEIDFLGMHFAYGAYIPGPHVCEELVKFPDTNFTVKQLQQFLGVINYVRDFIPDVFTYISLLTKMLTKKAPAWGKDLDDAVCKIKNSSKEVKTLHIPSDGLKILQTDSSNEYWSAILLEEKDGQWKV